MTLKRAHYARSSDYNTKLHQQQRWLLLNGPGSFINWRQTEAAHQYC